MKLSLSIRKISFLCFLMCLGLLSFGAYLQSKLGLVPCALCLIQRFLFLILGFLFFVGALYRPGAKVRRVYYTLCSLLSLTGASFAMHQVELQQHPQTGSCGASLEYMLSHYAPMKALSDIFSSRPDCSEIGWWFMGYSIAQWSMISFAFLALISLIQALRRERPKR